MSNSTENVIYADGIEIVIPRAQSHYILKEEEELCFFNGCGSWSNSNEFINCSNQMNFNEDYVFVHRSATPIPFNNECENSLFCENSFDEEYMF